MNEKEKNLIQKAFETVMKGEGETILQLLYSNLLNIHLYTASLSISNSRSITSSYRMTNKPSTFSLIIKVVINVIIVAPTSPSFYVSRILYNYDIFIKKFGHCFEKDQDRFTCWKEEVFLFLFLFLFSFMNSLLTKSVFFSKQRLKISWRLYVKDLI